MLRCSHHWEISREVLKTLVLSEKKNKELSLTPCNNDHKPVWFYDDQSCPLCVAKMLIEEYELDLQDMREQLLDLETEVERLQSTISDLESN